MNCYLVRIQNHKTGELEAWEVEASSLNDARLIAQRHVSRHGGEVVEVRRALWSKR